MKDDMPDDIEFTMTPVTLLSKCCGANSVIALYETKYGNVVGICEKCKEYTTFEPELENER